MFFAFVLKTLICLFQTVLTKKEFVLNIISKQFPGTASGGALRAQGVFRIWLKTTAHLCVYNSAFYQTQCILLCLQLDLDVHLGLDLGLDLGRDVELKAKM